MWSARPGVSKKQTPTACQTLDAVLEHIRSAQRLAHTLGLKNILQPGLLKELVIAERLGHQVISSKHHADACSVTNQELLYEHLSCSKGGSFQMDRVFSRPVDKRARSLERIRRDHKVYCAVFSAQEPLTLVSLHELEPVDVLAEAVRQLDASSNDISHLSFSRRWVHQYGHQLM